MGVYHGVHQRRSIQEVSIQDRFIKGCLSEGVCPRGVHPKGTSEWVLPRRPQGLQAQVSGAGAEGPCSCLVPLLPSLCPADRLPTGRREAAPRDLLAMRLHLDNGTALPAAAAVRLRWRVGVMSGCPRQRAGMGHRDEAGAPSPCSIRVPPCLVTLPVPSRC